jgi:hypothetical protein
MTSATNRRAVLGAAACHTASLAEDLHKKWSTLFDQLSALKAA